LKEEKAVFAEMARDLERAREIKSITAKKAQGEKESQENEIGHLKNEIEAIKKSIEEKNEKLKSTTPDLKKF
jgi:hypothetical protein